MPESDARSFYDLRILYPDGNMVRYSSHDKQAVISFLTAHDCEGSSLLLNLTVHDEDVYAELGF